MHVCRSLGGDVRQDPPHGKLFCLACMHARTHARAHAHTAEYGRFGFVKFSGLSVVRFSGFTCFRSVFGSACEYGMFFWGMLRISLSWPIWEAWGRDSHTFSQGIWVSVFLVPAELQFYTWLCGFFELAAVLIAFCTYFLECFQCLLMWIVVWLYFACVFLSNSASASLDYQKNAISSSFVQENARTVDANFTRVFACTLTIWMIFLPLSLLNSVQIFVLICFSSVF